MSKWRSIGLGAGAGLLFVLTLTIAAIRGWSPYVYLGGYFAFGGLLVAAITLLVTARRPGALALVAASAVQVVMVPAAWFSYDRTVADAKAYCAALADGTADESSPAALAQPGHSARYAFRFDRSGTVFNCRFPDPTVGSPLGGRTYWSGESSDGSRWQWEHLMD